MVDPLSDGLKAARQSGDERAVVEALVAQAEAAPLFARNLDRVHDWLVESRDLAHRVVLRPRIEVLVVARQAEVFLAGGSPASAAEIAREARDLARRLGEPGLEDRAALLQARALVRLGHQDDAVAVFEAVVERELGPGEREERVVPGMAFLAVGEAHLFEGRYAGAYRPLEQAIGLLPREKYADRLRWDALVGLGMLDHRGGDIDAAAVRYAAAVELADAHQSVTEQVESLLLMGTLQRGQGRREEARRLLERALALSSELGTPHPMAPFPTERLRGLVGSESMDQLIDRAIELAGSCGAQHDLMGYVQLTTLVAALLDMAGQSRRARETLDQVASTLEAHGVPEEAGVVRWHRRAYEDPRAA